MAYIIGNVLHDYKIPANIYKDISSQATLHHTTIKKEMTDRLARTLSLNYNYASNEQLMHVANTVCSGSKDFKIFNLNILDFMLDTFNELRKYRPDPDELNYEINLRLVYTLYDPFYQ